MSLESETVNMFISLIGLGPEIDYASEGQQQCKLQTRPLAQMAPPPEQTYNCLTEIKIWS
jgi:hypothetical protein